MSLQEDTGTERNLRVLARWRSTARVLVEALPYILKYDQKTIVVKFGGNAMRIMSKDMKLYAEMAHYQRRSPAKVADFVMRLQEIAEDFAAQFQRQSDHIPEVPLDH